ncbi:hypothetical protein HPP92_006773 [Vanilla planifolia]|uniref:Protein kinase domain-containing protein n=1 Tax=Vanilla planifolia TaxID=51239 RepID=A0A835VAL9_VANPL|nr:hypothetical protein HPP92_006773 [Vanilla planifolia]
MKKGEYQVAKWNGTKVSVKILDKESYSDPDSMGMNYLHQCKPEPVIHCNLKPKNVLLDNVGQLKIGGFGLTKLSKVSADKFKLAHPKNDILNLSIYSAPEICRNEIFDGSVDTYSFGVILYEMIEGAQPFHNKAREDAVKLICLEGKRPHLKYKSKSYPVELKE